MILVFNLVNNRLSLLYLNSLPTAGAAGVAAGRRPVPEMMGIVCFLAETEYVRVTHYMCCLFLLRMEQMTVGGALLGVGVPIGIG